jgi:RimJ/RimL family protein N-acetyltransferase
VGLPLDTARLHLRVMHVADAPAHAAYRNDPENARYQLWDLPYTVEQAIESMVGQDGRDDIVLGDWVTIAIELDGEVIGDVVTNVDPTGGIAEIGYTLARAHHGRGYATEAALALTTILFDEIGVERVYGELAPENVASQRVLEAVGLRYEGIKKRSFWWRNEWTDNMSYAATKEEFDEWRARPRARPDTVRLVPLDTTNERSYVRLTTHHSQERFVAPMLVSFADALFPEVVDGAPVVPWLRGIEADGEPAGFLMVAEVTEHHPEPYLWRLLIDRRHQRRGIGGAALGLLFDDWRSAGVASALTSWVDGPGSPRPFYERLGFKPTGEIVDGETEARIQL